MRLDYKRNRKGGPFLRGQWCDFATLNATAARGAMRARWAKLAPAPLRPLVYAGNATELNRFRLWGAPFAADDLALFRHPNGHTEWDDYFVRCPPLPRDQGGPVRVPLAAAGNGLLGFIECVKPADKS